MLLDNIISALDNEDLINKYTDLSLNVTDISVDKVIDIVEFNRWYSLDGLYFCKINFIYENSAKYIIYDNEKKLMLCDNVSLDIAYFIEEEIINILTNLGFSFQKGNHNNSKESSYVISIPDFDFEDAYDRLYGILIKKD